jgi:hypothetical protein
MLLMGNHYHLVLETPEANLIHCKWEPLQTSFTPVAAMPQIKDYSPDTYRGGMSVGLLLQAVALLHAQSSPPQAVVAYYENTKAALTTLSQSIPADRSFKVDVREAHWQAIDSFRSVSPAWLVWFQVATEKRLTFSHVAIIKGDGTLLMPAPGGAPWFKDELGIESNIEIVPYSEVTFVRIGSNQSILAVATEPQGTYAAGMLRLFSMEPSSRSLLLDEGHASGQTASDLSWEGMYYFKDINGDGRKDILINRRVHQREAGVSSMKNQKLIFAMGAQQIELIEATDQYSATLVTLFQQAKADANVPHIGQYGLPFEEGSNLGEAIFPEEQEAFGIPYTTVQQPDLGPVPSMLPTTFAE